MTYIPEPNEVGKIGAYVRRHLPQILQYCRDNPDELARLQDKAYCLATFRQSYPVLVAKTSDKQPHRYWAKDFSAPFSDEGYWVTSEWTESIHTAHFVIYLVEKGISPSGLSDEFIIWAEDAVAKFGSTGSAPGGPRYGSYAIGIAQNALVRFLLSNVGHEAFTKADWEAVKDQDFGGLCAYCGEQRLLTMDHAVPINRLYLGEHRIGNLVPACSTCNGKKGQADVTEFLEQMHREQPGQARSRLEAVAAHASAHGYARIENLEGIGPLVEEARAKVKEVADEYLRRISDHIDQQVSATQELERTGR